MKLNDTICIKIKNNDFYRVTRILASKNISFSNTDVLKDSFTIVVSYEDYLKIKKIFRKDDYELVSFYGVRGLKRKIEKHFIFILSCVFGFLIMFTLSRLIFEIEVNTKDAEIKEIIYNELENYGIEKYKFTKSYKELEEIKNNILNNNRDILEWMSIEVHGTRYVINLNLRISEEEKRNSTISDIVASKDGKILHIESSSGVIVKEINDYVKKGETIITGNIIKSDKYLKGQVESKGRVYAEVWYTADVSVPLNYTEYIKTGLEYNEYFTYIFDKKITFINDYNIKNVMYKESVFISKPYLPFKIYKRETNVYEYKMYTLTEKEAYDLAIKKATDKINVTLSDDEYIMDKKVLKKTLSSSKMVLRVFFKVYENITEKKEIEKIEYNTDITKKGS